jgi:hypothetical protein
MKTPTYIFTIIAMILCSFGVLFPQGVRLSIEMDREVYYEGSQIWLISSLQNHSDSTYKYRHFVFDGENLHLIVKDSRGTKLNETCPIIDYLLSKENELEPGTELMQLIHVSSHYSIAHNEKNVTLLPFPSKLPIDTYSVQSEYFGIHDTLRSNILTFQVVSPPQAEQAAYRDVRDYFLFNYFSRTESEISDSLLSFIKKYPQSIYSLDARGILASRYHYSHPVNADSIRLQIIESYPEYFESLNSLMMLSRIRNEREHFLDTISAQNNNSLGRFARFLKRMEQK